MVTLAMVGLTVATLNSLLMVSFRNLDSDLKGYRNEHLSTSNTTQPLAPMQFAASLFCSISTESDRKKYSRTLEDIHRLQFEHNCDASPHRKYYILSMDDARTNRGFMSFIDHEYTPPFALSLFTNRTFVMTTNHDDRPWVYLPRNGKSIPTLCQNRTARDCIFKPVSNCTMAQIESVISFAKKTHNFTAIDYTNSAPNICRKSKDLDPDSFHELTKEYMVIYQRFECNLFWSRGRAMNRGLIETMIERRNWSISYHEFNALIWSVLLRMQENIRSMVHQIARDSLTKYRWTSKRNTIGIPIRGSDKCRRRQSSTTNRTFLNDPEMECVEPQTFLDVAERVNQWTNHTVNAMIVTSEDEDIMDIIRKSAASSSMLTVFNDGDMMQSCGLVQDMDTETRSNELEMMKLILSMLSTMKLQMHSNYYVLQRQSNWAHAIWTLSSCIHCQIDGVHGDIDGNEDEQRYCIDLRGTENNKTILWDPLLFGKEQGTSETENECYRRDRFDEQ